VLELGHRGLTIEDTLDSLQMPTLTFMSFYKWLRDNDIYWRHPQYADMSIRWDPKDAKTNSPEWKLYAAPSTVARDILDTDMPEHRPTRLSADKIAKVLRYIEANNQPRDGDDEEKEPVLVGDVLEYRDLPRVLLTADHGIIFHVRSALRAHPIASCPPRARTASGARGPLG
jgi:hypothetical protein